MSAKLRSAALGLVLAVGAAHADEVSPRVGELTKLRIENTLKRAQFDRYVTRGNRLVARSVEEAKEAGVVVTKPPKFGMKDAQADKMIGSAKRELELLQAQPSTPAREARIDTLAAQLAEYEAMPRTGPRTSAFVLLGTDQVYLRLDRKGANPHMVANTLAHEMVHIRDLPKTNALWDEAQREPARMTDYKAFLSDGETRAYGEGSRVGARLGEAPFNIGQPITDSNAPDHPLVQRSITNGYLTGVKQAVGARGMLADATPEQRVLASSYLAGYEAGMPGVLREREAWKVAHPPKDGFVEDIKLKASLWSGAVTRAVAVGLQYLQPLHTTGEAFAAGQADVKRDLHPMARLERIAN